MAIHPYRRLVQMAAGGRGHLRVAHLYVIRPRKPPWKTLRAMGIIAVNHTRNSNSSFGNALLGYARLAFDSGAVFDYFVNAARRTRRARAGSRPRKPTHTRGDGRLGCRYHRAPFSWSASFCEIDIDQCDGNGGETHQIPAARTTGITTCRAWR